MKRIKVGEIASIDRSGIDRRVGMAQTTLNDSISIVKRLIGRMDTAILQDVLTNGGKTRKELEQTMLDDINKLSSVLMKDEFRNRLKEALNSFDKISVEMVKSISSVTDIVPITNWIVEKDKVYIMDWDKLYEEATAVYIAGDKSIELYNRLKELTNELNSINKLISMHNTTTVQHPPLQRGLIWLDTNKEYKLNGNLTANIVKEVFKMQ